MKVRELLSDSSKWIKDTAAKTFFRIHCSSGSHLAACWCLSGAIDRCYPEMVENFRIKRLVRTKLPRNSITAWNDDPERTFEEVKSLVTELDI